jgi:hypothetical protein
MHSIYRRIAYSVTGVFVVLLYLSQVRAAESLPLQLADEEFWKIISSFSEPDGTFPSENFVSNERSYQQIFGQLAEGRQPASAYIGVGPEQNFTYILALKPQIAFVVDIRRQNMIEHLMYKALFELSADRAEFLSRLFSRPRPNVDLNATVGTLVDAFDNQPVDAQVFQDNLDAIQNRLVKNHGFPLNANDQVSLRRVVQAFRLAGPNLTYNGPNSVPGLMPGFGEILKQTDKNGVNRGFLASEANFQVIRELQMKNLLIPVVGDFAGPQALRSVGEYLKNHSATVTAFYTSNVEQYLFQNDVWREFYSNVATLPVNSKSVFVRGLIRSASGEYSPSPALPVTSRYETGLFSIPELVDDFKGGSVRTYNDIVRNRQ